MNETARDSERSDNYKSMLDIVGLLFRRRRLIIFSTLLTALFSVLYSIGSLLLPPERSYLPNVYSPRAMVLVNSSDSSGLSSMLGNAAGLASIAGFSIGVNQSSGALAVMLAKSNTTIDELNAEFDFYTRYKIKKGMKAEIRLAFLDRLAVSFEEKTSVLSISYEDRDPFFAQKVVNRLVEILERRFAKLSGNKAIGQKTRLEAKLADVQSQVDFLEGKVKTFTAKYGVLNVEAMATEQVTVLAKLRSELILKDMEIENYRKLSTIDDPVVRGLISQRDSLGRKIKEVEAGDSVLPSQKDIPKLAFEYAGLKRDLEVQMEVFKLLTQQYELAKLNAEGQDPVFQVLELAEVPDQKSGPSRGMLCVVTTMAGFLFSILATFAFEAISAIRKDPEAMRKLRGGA